MGWGSCAQSNVGSGFLGSLWKLVGSAGEDRGAGSFDCVRLAPHSAQDDNFGEGSAIDFGLLVSVFGVDVGLVV